jgi:transcriptional regulator with XRE-family HTH domain
MQDGRPVTFLTKDLGARLAAYRLSRNMRQDDVSVQAGVSRGVVARLEAGEGGTIDSLIRVLGALGLAGRVSDLVPIATPSPLDPQPRGEPRQRARPVVAAEDDEPWRWGA